MEADAEIDQSERRDVRALQEAEWKIGILAGDRIRRCVAG
jgi:hypothetical protein